MAGKKPLGERSVRLFGVWFSSSKYICISPSSSVLVSDGYVTTSTFTNSNDSRTSTGSISFTNSLYGSICDTFMNNGYKGNLSLGNYTFENREKLEFQTHGFTGDPIFRIATLSHRKYIYMDVPRTLMKQTSW